MPEHQDPLDSVLQAAAQAYHQPPPTPRRELWWQLQYARTVRRTSPRRRTAFHPLVWATGVAALLTVGVGLGRLSMQRRGPAPVPMPAVVNEPANIATYRIAATEYLEQAEVFLTLFRMSVRRGATDPLTSTTARPLLATNRLLLDSPAGLDPQIRLLLEDLEFVLAQITQLSPQPAKEDLELITTGITQTDILTRLGHNVSAESANAFGT